MYIFRLKNFSRFDDKYSTGNGRHSGYSRTTNNFDYSETDDLKRMKDSEILAEDEIKRPGIGKILDGGLKGAVGAGVLGAGASALLGSGTWKDRLKGSGKGALIGAGIGALLGGLRGAQKRNRDVERADKYNERLRYAQRKAAKRERSDFKSNMSQRDGYSY